MIRLVLFAVALFALLVAGHWLYRRARASQLDWTGIAFAGGFIVLAFYLRHATGLG